MKSIKYLWGVALIALIIAIGGYFYPQVVGLGAAGDINTIAVRFVKGLSVGLNKQYVIDSNGVVTTGGALYSTTTSGTVTELASNITPNTVLSVNPSIGKVVYTLPTKANIGAVSPTFIPNSNDTVTKWLINATTTGSGTVGIVQIVGNTGVIVRNISTTTAADFLYAGNEAKLTFRRMASSTDIYVDVEIFH